MKGFVCPAKAGVASTVGFLNAPVSYDYFHSYIALLKSDNLDKINEIYVNLKENGIATLKRSNESLNNIKFILQLDMRHKGQGHEILVDVSYKDIKDKNIENIKYIFYKSYERIYGYSHKRLEIEITKIRLKAIGKKPKFNIIENNHQKDVKINKRKIYLEKGKYEFANIYNRSMLNINKKYKGPAIIEEIDSTMVIPSDCTFFKDETQNIIAHFNK